VSELIGGALLSGQSIQKTSRQIRERFDVGKYYAERLVRTETNHFNNEADALAYEEMDVDKYVFLATLDTRTSDICQRLDNKVFELKKRRVGVNYPPMHPNCRSKTRAYMGEEIEKTLKRRARNPITGQNEIIGNISYSEWANKHGLKPILTNNANSHIIHLNRKTQNTGVFTNLPERMTKKHIRYVAEKYGVDLKGITLNIDYNAELLRTSFAGRADPENVGSITFFPNAFKSREELIRTLYHEIEHTKQYRMYGVKYVQDNRGYFEDLAYKAEDDFIDNLKRKGVSL
jgi:SPP1 gp7 family putative phage head morphogenesis protein